MKNKTLAILSAGVIAMSGALPCFADDDGPVHSVVQFFGATSAMVIDVPQGIVVDSLYRVPLKVQRTLAEHFGDPNGLGQNFVGAVLGIPAGFVWGIPYGALHGAKHAIGVGWDKPFSTESYIVTEEK